MREVKSLGDKDSKSQAVERFNRQIEALLAGQAVETNKLNRADRRALELADRLERSDFSRQSRGYFRLRQELMAGIIATGVPEKLSTAPGDKHFAMVDRRGAGGMGDGHPCLPAWRGRCSGGYGLPRTGDITWSHPHRPMARPAWASACAPSYTHPICTRRDGIGGAAGE